MSSGEGQDRCRTGKRAGLPEYFASVPALIRVHFIAPQVSRVTVSGNASDFASCIRTHPCMQGTCQWPIQSLEHRLGRLFAENFPGGREKIP
jgi:hypothetical protein